MSEKVLANERVKEYLKGYKRNLDKLRSLEEQMKSLRITKEAARAQSISGMPKGSNQLDLSDVMVDIEALEDKIRAMEAECIKRKVKIESIIADLEDGKESSILHKKYIELKKWEVICVEVGYEWAQTHRKHSDALEKLKMIHDDTLFCVNMKL